jgi:glycosyltransferase involved in cell wall biosynthesis
VKILALPRDAANPYQDLLYGEMGHLGVQVRYLGLLTPSYTLNLLLQPLELAVRRLGGARLIHIHWVYTFALYGSYRFPFLRRIAQAWFAIWLRTVRLLGFRLVWTAHNVLPSSPVFADDVSARRQLAAACDLVLAHSESTLAELSKLGVVPRKSAVIPHGPYIVAGSPESLRVPGTGQGPRRLLFFGKVRSYKGVEDLLEAFMALPPGLEAHLTVAGECSGRLAATITDFARRSAGRLETRLYHIPDGELSRLFAEADVVVLPFRQITTSGSAILALCHGRPLVVPDLPSLNNLPDGAVSRYDGTVSGLVDALADVTTADAAVLAKMSAEAYAYCSAVSWGEIAGATTDNLKRLFDDEH